MADLEYSVAFGVTVLFAAIGGFDVAHSIGVAPVVALALGVILLFYKSWRS